MADSKPQVMKTPQSSFTGPLVVDPVTRIEGHLRIVTEIEGGKVKNVWSSSQLFRGLEIILKGRDPQDAQHFTQRACGVCTYVHALASTRAVDNAVGVKVPENATLMRNLVMASQYMHDHITHFYVLHALDWVDVANALKADPAAAAKIANQISPHRKTTAEDLKAVQDKVKALVESGQLGIFTNAYFLGGHPSYYLPAEVNLIATAHYLEALRLQVKAARAMAIFGAKNPHTQFTVVGGCTNYGALEPKAIEEYLSLFKEVKAFIHEVYIPDLLAVASYYKDWAAIGGTSNFLSFGEFPQKEEFGMDDRFMPSGAIMKRDIKGVQAVDPKQILEHVAHSWYKGTDALHPFEGVTDPQYTSLDDKDRYSWMKAPRYMGEPMETGPLASVLVAYAKGHKGVTEYVHTVLKALDVKPEALFSTLGRTAARCIETAVIADQIEGWVHKLADNVKKGNNKLVEEWKMPDKAQGVGFVGAPRGALSHWINIDGGKIANFQLVVPSTWSLGPRDSAGKLSPVEEALMGTPIADPKRPVEILRTVHSFDPCIACGVHVIQPDSNEVLSFKVL